MMSVGRSDSPWRYACDRDQCSATRPAARYAVAKPHVLIVCAARSGGAATSSRSERTPIAASDVAVTAIRSSSSSSERSREPYIPRMVQRASTVTPKTTSQAVGGDGTSADCEPSFAATPAMMSIEASSEKRASDQTVPGRK
jgi:hypothetical protein